MAKSDRYQYDWYIPGYETCYSTNGAWKCHYQYGKYCWNKRAKVSFSLLCNRIWPAEHPGQCYSARRHRYNNGRWMETDGEMAYFINSKCSEESGRAGRSRQHSTFLRI